MGSFCGPLSFFLSFFLFLFLFLFISHFLCLLAEYLTCLFLFFLFFFFFFCETGIVCVDQHLGTVMPGSLRANHRHFAKSELLVTWGAKSYWKIEDPSEAAGFREFVIEADEAFAVIVPRGIGHVFKNLDTVPLNLLGCSDQAFDYLHPKTEYDIWAVGDLGPALKD